MGIAKGLHWINVIGMAVIIIGIIIYAIMDMWYLAMLTFAVGLFIVLAWTFFD